MKAIVLAAGTGSRLGEITKAKTKGMAPVLGKRMIDYLLDFFELDCFEQVFVVGGFHYEDLRDHVNKKNYSNVIVLENKEYLKGNIFTLIRGLNEFTGGSFLITNVDHIYPGLLFKKMKSSFDSITAMCDFDRSLTDDDMKVKLRHSNRSVELISKDLKEFDCGYIGMTYVDASKDKIYKEAIDKALERFGEKAVVENILQILADDEENAPQICDLSNIGWYEIDTEDDLKKAEQGLLNDPNFDINFAK